MKNLALVLFFSTIISTNQVQADSEELVKDESSNTVYYSGTCKPTKTKGLETAFEKVIGNYKEVQIGCCARTVEDACGEKYSDISGNVKQSKFANCLSRSKGSSIGVCADLACQAWAQDCKNLSVDEVKKAFSKIESD